MAKWKQIGVLVFFYDIMAMILILLITPSEKNRIPVRILPEEEIQESPEMISWWLYNTVALKTVWLLPAKYCPVLFSLLTSHGPSWSLWNRALVWPISLFLPSSRQCSATQTSWILCSVTHKSFFLFLYSLLPVFYCIKPYCIKCGWSRSLLSQWSWFLNSRMAV